MGAGQSWRVLCAPLKVSATRESPRRLSCWIPSGALLMVEVGLLTEAPLESERRSYDPLWRIDILRDTHLGTYAEIEVGSDSRYFVEVAPELGLGHELEVRTPSWAWILLMPPAEEARCGNKTIARSELPYPAELIVMRLGDTVNVLIERCQAQHRTALRAQISIGDPRHIGIGK